MPVRLGDTTPTDFRLGDAAVQRLYVGDNLVWERAGPVVIETGSLRTIASDYVILGSGTAGYVTPTLGDRNAFKSIWADIKAGNIAVARSAANPYGYDVVEFQDTETSRFFTLLRERAARTRYWGLYAWGKDAGKSDRIAIATHPQADLNTEVQAADLLIRSNASAGFFSGTHRNASATLDAEGNNITDPANAIDPPSSILQAITEATVNSSHLVIEPHGFGTGMVPPLGSAHYRGGDVASIANTPVGSSSIVIDPAGTTATLALPTGCKVGDRVFAFLAVRSASATVTVPAGWTLVAPVVTDGTGLQGLLYQRLVVDTDFTNGAPNSFTWSWSVSVKALLAMVAYGSCDVVNVASGIDEPGTSVTTHSTATITTTVADTVLVAFYVISNSSAWSTSGATEATNRIISVETSATASAAMGIYDTDDYTRPVGKYSASAQNVGASSFGTFFLIALQPKETVREVQSVLSSGALPQPQWIYDLAAKYRAKGYVAVANDGTWPYMAADNVQAAFTRSANGRFLHMEQTTSVRTDATLRTAFITELLPSPPFTSWGQTNVTLGELTMSFAELT